jgi:hypothetical protein
VKKKSKVQSNNNNITCEIGILPDNFEPMVSYNVNISGVTCAVSNRFANNSTRSFGFNLHSSNFVNKSCRNCLEEILRVFPNEY